MIFNTGFSGGPVAKYKLTRKNTSDYQLCKLYIYASLVDNKREKGIYYDSYPGLVRITIEMPDFRIGKDKLVVVDETGEYSIDYR